ncbi:MAG: alpha/beta fold hydrolase [Acidimicrobiales bacterium]|nr:alpha/beta fold hydrolase [Acidimicrobiales bacterium]HRW36196.1 alpha/beta fold hydrolase [Aquihabitans sp.]
MIVRRLLVVVALVASVLGLVALPASPAGAAAKDPVVIVPGFTTGPIIDTGYLPLRDRLRRAGYDVTLLTYPDYGLGDIRTNSARLAATVASVKARTGAAKVDLVSHSMGGLVSRYYVKSLGGASSVDSLIMLGTPNYGTNLANIAEFLTFGSCVGITSCEQMARGSGFLNDLNAGDDTIGSVRYTSIATKVDLIVTPYTTSFLAKDGNIANIAVQDQCFARLPGHLGLILDGAVADGVKDALAGGSVRMNCWAL